MEKVKTTLFFGGRWTCFSVFLFAAGHDGAEDSLELFAFIQKIT
jgi:hypothetical protein